MLEVTVVKPCPECKGTGKIVMFSHIDPCPKCDGTGKVEVVEPWVIKGGG